MTKPILSALVALTLVAPVTLASASPVLDAPSCGDEKKPEKPEEPKS